MSFAPGSLIDLPALGLSTGDTGNRLGPMTKWMRDNQELFLGKSVLDLGSNAGHFPVLYALLGAVYVRAVEGRKAFEDSFRSDILPALPPELDGAEFINWQTCDIRDFHTTVKFDVLSCLGLIYHVEDGWAHLERLVKESQAKVMIFDSQLWDGAGTCPEAGNEGTNCLLPMEQVPHPTVESVEFWFAANGWGYSRVLHNWQTNGDQRGMWHVKIK